MAIVNFVTEHIRFMEYASEEKLKGPVMLLWYALMHQMNQRAQGNVWPEEFVRIDNDRLLSYLPMEYDTFTAARNKLKQIGRIDYIPGERNKTNPAYKMIYFYPNYARNRTEDDGNSPNVSPVIMPMDGLPAEKWENILPENQNHTKNDEADFIPKNPDNIGGKTDFIPKNPDKTGNKPGFIPKNPDKIGEEPGFIPKNSDKQGGKQGGKLGGKQGGKQGGNMGDIYYKHKQDINPKQENRGFDEEENDDGEGIRARARDGGEEDDPIENRAERMKAFRSVYRADVGRNPTNREIDRLLTYCHISGMPDNMAVRAIGYAAQSGASDVISYAVTTLEDWKRAHVYQPHQIDEYMGERNWWKNGIVMDENAQDIFDSIVNAAESRRQENVRAGLEKEKKEKDGGKEK